MGKYDILFEKPDTSLAVSDTTKHGKYSILFDDTPSPKVGEPVSPNLTVPALIQGFAKSATLGLAPRYAPPIGAALSYIPGLEESFTQDLPKNPTFKDRLSASQRSFDTRQGEVKESNPGSKLIGEIAGYASPGTAAAKISKPLMAAAKASYLPKLNSILAAMAAGGTPIGVTEAVTGGKDPLKQGVQAALISGGLQSAGPTIFKAIKEGLGALTGVPVRAMEAFSKNPEAISGSTANKVAADLMDFVNTTKLEGISSAKQANAMLPMLGTVHIAQVRKVLDDAVKSNVFGPQEVANANKLSKWLETIPEGVNQRLAFSSGGGPVSSVTTNTKVIPAATMNMVKKALQDEARPAYNKEMTPEYESVLKDAAREARLALETAAKFRGKPEYVELMRDASDKLSVVQDIRKSIGLDPNTQIVKAESFIDKLFNKGPVAGTNLKKLTGIDRDFGTSFVEDAQNAKFAQQLGPEGVPTWFPKWKTGATVVPYALSGGLGYLGSKEKEPYKKALMFAGASLSSPKVASALIGAGNNPSTQSFIRQLIINLANQNKGDTNVIR